MTDHTQNIYRNLKKRSLILQIIRDFFTQNGFLEVETPLRCPSLIPEENIDAVTSEDWYLQASPELCMKRLISNRFKKIFQICKSFRQNERGSRHLPEYTLLEWYSVGDTYIDLMDQCERLVKFIASRLQLNHGIAYQGQFIHLDTPWQKISVKEAFERYGSKNLDQALEEKCFDEIMSFEIEPYLGNTTPAFIYDYPNAMASLAKFKKEDNAVSQRFEFFIAGIELANGFTELTDPVEQRKRFQKENNLREKTNKRPCPMPEKFLGDLSNMPDTAGIALGIDRLVMFFCDAATIDDVVTFTPEDL